MQRNFDDMQLGSIELFCLAVEQASFTGAANIAGVTPAAVSRSIGRLEERFNLMTERLAAARGDLERTDRDRRRLFADITHELATPLTSIRGYVETLLNPMVPVSNTTNSTPITLPFVALA